jgi:hypothetical protein
MFNRRKFLAASAAGLLSATTGLRSAFAAGHYSGYDEVPAPQPKVIPVANYIHPELATDSTDPVGIAWVMAVDISGSINSSTNEYQAQLNALADAIERDDFRESIFQQAGPGSAALFVVDYDTQSQLQIPGIDFRENSPEKFRAVANIIRNIPRRNSGGTAHDAALQNATICFDYMPWECDRKHVNIMTDGTGNSYANRNEQRTLAERHEAIVSSLTTRVSTSDIYAWCEENLTTPAATYRRANGSFLSRGSTVEVATELETQGSNVGRYQDEVYLAIRKQILLQTASLNIEPRTRYAQADLQSPARRALFTNPFTRTL